MNLDDLQHKLIAAARAHPPADTVPYAFERRISHQIKRLGTGDLWGLWANALWRAAAPCVGLALVLAAWSLLSEPKAASGLDVSQAFENTVFAAASVDQLPPEPPR